MAIQTLESNRDSSLQILVKKNKEPQISGLDRVLVIVCAYNEELAIANAINSLRGMEILVIDDGSTDSTREIALAFGATVMSHESRLGKAASLADGISYALQNRYEIVVEIGADAIPEDGCLEKILGHFNNPLVGGVSCKQIPIGKHNSAYFIDELIWAILAEGKKLQMATKGTSHLGAVFFAFRPDLVESIMGSVNDDEKVGISIKDKGYKIIFEDGAIVFFDASSSIGHILQRRRRMYYGHMKFDESAAPSMQIKTSVLGLASAVLKNPRRLAWVLPSLSLDLYSRLLAWKDVRDPRSSERYRRWVTTYAKNNNLVIRNSRVD